MIYSTANAVAIKKNERLIILREGEKEVLDEKRNKDQSCGTCIFS